MNGEVRYSLDSSVSSIFHIDSVSGTITTKVKLDHETTDKYSFTVTATDQGTGGRQGTTAVTVNILDVNDNKPVFQNLPYTANVLEDSSTSTFVTTVRANDTDSGKKWKNDTVRKVGTIQVPFCGSKGGGGNSENAQEGRNWAKESISFDLLAR